MSEETGREISLDALVNKLHAEGVEKGRIEAEKLVGEAREQAAAILAKARADAEELSRTAQQEAEELERNTAASVKLAARDTLLQLRQHVGELLEQAFKGCVADALNDPAFLRDLITDMAQNWADGDPVAVSVRPDVGEALLKLAGETVGDQLADGIDIRLNRSITAGFRIRRKGRQVAYDVSDDSIAEALRVHLNPRLAELLEL